MASLRKNHKGKFHIIRGRLADGSSFEYAIDIPQEPPGLSLGDPGYAGAKAELARLAQEEADDVETRSRGKMDEKEYEARAKFRAKKVLRENAKTSPPAFILGWLWEHVIRNRIDYTKTLFLCNLMNRLLTALSKAQCTTIHDVRQAHFDSVVLQMRLDSYSPGVVNNAIDYLNALGREIEKTTGNNVSGGLAKEATDYDERLPFGAREIRQIFEVIPTVVGSLAVEWTIFILIMLYTEMRPSSATIVRRKDIRLEEGVIRIISTKTENFRNKHKWKPMHRCLLLYVKAYLDDVSLEPDDFLCKHLANMSEKSISNKFTEVLRAAKIDQMRNKGENRINPFSPKSLYSVKHTSCVWLDAAGAREDEKEEHCDSTEQAQEHYRHLAYEDPELLAIRRQKVNRMPAVDVTYQPRTKTSSCDTTSNTTPPTRISSF